MWIRREEPGDAEAIRVVHTEAFGKGTGSGTGAEVGEAVLVDELRASDAWIARLSFVAWYGSGIAGHVVCTRAFVDDRPVLALGPIGVRPKYQGRGLGSALVCTVLGAADAMDEPLIGLLGSPAFYQRFGFEVGAMMHVLPPDADWLTHFQVRRLAAFDPAIQGTFRYPAAFDLV